MKDPRKILGVVVLVVLLVLGSWYFFWPNRIIANINGDTITTGTVDTYLSILKAYRDPTSSPPTGREAFNKILENAKIKYVYYTVLGGAPITREELIETSKLIDQQTLAPSVLGRVQYNLGGKESEAYLQHYILPVVTRTRVQDQLLARVARTFDGDKKTLEGLLANDAYKTSDKVSQSAIELSSKAASTTDTTLTIDLRKQLTKAKAFSSTAPRTLGVLAVTELPFIVAIDGGSKDTLSISIYSVKGSDPTEFFYTTAAKMPQTIYDPYYRFSTN